MTRRESSYVVVDEALAPGEVDLLLADIGAACRDDEPATIHRAHGDRPLHYRVIDGDRVARALPGVDALLERFLPDAARWYGSTLVPLRKSAVAVNVNITPPGGTYRWHYDRNVVTVLLYLNVVAGGAIEVCPGYRVELPARWALPRVQAALDGLLRARPLRRWLGRPITIEPHPGRMVMMRGRRCLHSVRPVEPGSADRTVVVLSFDPPTRALDPGAALDRYLYDERAIADGDPNYDGGATARARPIRRRASAPSGP